MQVWRSQKYMNSVKKAILSLILTGWAAVTASATDPVKHTPVPVLPDKAEKIEKAELVADNKFTFPIGLGLVQAAGMEMLFEDTETEQNTIAEDLINMAKTYLGTRYRSGGKTPAGFDCSGFTGYIFGQFGYELGASSRDQYTQGEQIDNEAIVPGDLLFFNGRAVGSRIGHVGIAISEPDENGVVTFIHSAFGGGIRIDKTSAPYYSRRYKGARRVIL